VPKVAKELKALEVQRLKEPGLHFVGTVPGLALQIMPSGARSWLLRVMVGSKRREMGLGGYPAVTLAMAHEKAREARELIRQGLDPILLAREAQSALRADQAKALTFKQCALAYVAAHEAGWRNAKHVAQWRTTFETYAYPVMGELLVRDVELPHVLRVLEPIWRTKTTTASRLRGRIESVLDWAKGRGYRSGDNPAEWKGNLDAQLPRPEKVAKVEHHQALPVAEVGPFMRSLRAHHGVGARALEFAILTAARSGEVRGATWAEIDLDTGVWTLPPERMKAGREHRAPLSPAAIELIKAQPVVAGSPLVFTAPRGGQLSDMTLTAVLRRMEVAAVPHGFRSTFRDWAAERTNYPNEVCEMALAHVVGDKVEAAYRRGDLFDKRRRLMDDWAKFLAEVAPKGAVVPMRKKA